AGEFVEAAEDAAKVLQLAEQALDPRPLLVEAPIGLAAGGPGRMRWDDRHDLPLGDPVQNGIAVIGAIGEHGLDGDHRDIGEQGDGLRGVTRLARGQGEPQWVAEAVGEPVQLRG
ncbi:hypothetical protein RZS08_04395, partial [Arthrospira platensis SPKY1]|nr:hypothetical protein [Arthrospira platensis SPKY1]